MASESAPSSSCQFEFLPWFPSTDWDSEFISQINRFLPSCFWLLYFIIVTATLIRCRSWTIFHFDSFLSFKNTASLAHELSTQKAGSSSESTNAVLCWLLTFVLAFSLRRLKFWKGKEMELQTEWDSPRCVSAPHCWRCEITYRKSSALRHDSLETPKGRTRGMVTARGRAAFKVAHKNCVTYQIMRMRRGHLV